MLNFSRLLLEDNLLVDCILFFSLFIESLLYKKKIRVKKCFITQQNTKKTNATNSHYFIDIVR